MKHALVRLRAAIERLYRNLVAAEQGAGKIISRVHPKQQQSATNLIHYLALRCEDLRALQDELHVAGLSSLASSESHILRQVMAVLQRLGVVSFTEKSKAITYEAGTKLLHQRATTLFGHKPNSAIPHLMVTFDKGMATDYVAVKSLLKAGMNIARINCAHDNPGEWKKMIANIHKAVRSTGQPCKIYMDLAGPKIRTTLPGKGKEEGRLKLLEQELFYLVEADAAFDKKEKVLGCTLPGVVKDLRAGDRVLFDDGLFEAVVETPGERIAALRMVRISAKKPRIKPEKGINFPDTKLTVGCLTDFDKSVLPFAHQHADLLGFSFVRSVADVAELQELNGKAGTKKLPLILKIETFEAVQNLPALLLQGMAEPVFGVMIARGDLAVEIGFERLSEIQEEILWLCEAAHVPVIWATQVLETLNKSGIATRSEVTDAVRAAQAECVMLNKGKYLLTVLATLQDILHRTGGHHVKKRYVFRPLQIAERFLSAVN
ncbi:MAG: pyruvate kinase [Saprospiraceae bacterium]|nr:pyruvate kinase [Saprospiraceae bacterium]